MFRKTLFAIAAASAVAAGLTSANALPVRKIGPPVMKPHADHDHDGDDRGFDRHDRGFFFGSGFGFAPFFTSYDDTCLRQIWIKTSRGPRRAWVDMCDY